MRSVVLAGSLLALVTPVASAAQRVPRFERVPCPFDPPRWTQGARPECGYLVVPESRSKPDGRTLRLAVAIYRTKEASTAPPLLLLHGGPGGAGGIRARWPFFQTDLPRHRDIVIYDVRGAGLSEPQLCPGFYENTAPVFNRRSRESREQGYNEAVRTCVASLNSQGLDLSAYSTAVNAGDAIDLRHALGFETWDVYGVSYGARLALELMRRDPKGVHAVALLSPGVGDAGANAFTEQRALQRVFVACSTQPPCKSAFPTLEEDFHAVADELSRRPLEIAVDDAIPPTTVWLDGERFLREIWGQLAQTDNIPSLPLLISEFRRGDRAAAARRLLGTGMLAPYYPLGHLVDCNDYGAAYTAGVTAAKPKLRPVFQIVADDLREHCEGWLPHEIRADRPHMPADVPMLILHGEFDPRGTDLHMTELAVSFSHAYTYVLRGRGHSNLPPGCGVSVVERFLADPTHAPDASCLADVPEVVFATNRAETPLVFIIATAAGVQTPFAGEWKADFPLPPGESAIFDLRIDSGIVTGNIRWQSGGRPPVPIAGGSVDENTIALRVNSGDGQRTITFTGTLSGDEIAFRRDIEEHGPSVRPRPGLFGTGGPRTFTAKRTK